MSRLSQFYKTNINGIIITLSFHILAFLILYLSQFQINNQYIESEIIIDFKEILPPPVQTQQIRQYESNPDNIATNLRTNTASNKTSSKQNTKFDQQLQNDLDQAKSLLNDVNNQLKREIPTIDDLKMPDAPKANPDDAKNNSYTGESNIEYVLENRYHLKLPIPVYLAQGGGKVKVEIIVDRNGMVLKADPVIEPQLTEQILSYAKTAALKTRFNPNNQAPEKQKGYILYTFIPQR